MCLMSTQSELHVTGLKTRQQTSGVSPPSLPSAPPCSEGESVVVAKAGSAASRRDSAVLPL